MYKMTCGHGENAESCQFCLSEQITNQNLEIQQLKTKLELEEQRRSDTLKGLDDLQKLAENTVLDYKKEIAQLKEESAQLRKNLDSEIDFVDHILGKMDYLEKRVESCSPEAEYKQKLLEAEVAFWGSDWGEDGRAWDAQGNIIKENYLGIHLCLLLNDTFYYASADAETVPNGMVKRVWEIYEKWGFDGLLAWAALRRKEQPLKPLITDKYKEAYASLEKEMTSPDYNIRDAL